MLKTATLVLDAGALLVLVGCKTVQGMGKDIQKAGEGIENVSKKK
jgi:predicted small secreted protein